MLGQVQKTAVQYWSGCEGLHRLAGGIRECQIFGGEVVRRRRRGRVRPQGSRLAILVWRRRVLIGAVGRGAEQVVGSWWERRWIGGGGL